MFYFKIVFESILLYFQETFKKYYNRYKILFQIAVNDQPHFSVFSSLLAPHKVCIIHY